MTAWPVTEQEAAAFLKSFGWGAKRDCYVIVYRETHGELDWVMADGEKAARAKADRYEGVLFHQMVSYSHVPVTRDGASGEVS